MTDRVTNSVNDERIDEFDNQMDAEESSTDRLFHDPILGEPFNTAVTKHDHQNPDEDQEEITESQQVAMDQKVKVEACSEKGDAKSSHRSRKTHTKNYSKYLNQSHHQVVNSHSYTSEQVIVPENVTSQIRLQEYV
jgi:hypothetical protein